MTSRRRAGEPQVPRRPAGAPDGGSGRAGAPPQPREPAPGGNRAGSEAEAQDSAANHPTGVDAGQVERDLDELLGETRAERDEYLELAQRTRADFENYRRRAAQESEQAGRRAKSTLARELVPAVDNLERALRSAGVDPDAEEPADDGGGLGHGVLLVYRELQATLERAGVEVYDPTGERFDPTWHEALATRSEDGAEAGIVLETVEKGYRLDGQVLRPAKVVVSE
jgi:molecular chaperone GrpE